MPVRGRALCTICRVLTDLLIVGTVLVILIVVSTSTSEKAATVVVCGVALACFTGAAYERAASWWILIEVLGAAVTGWVACALLRASPEEHSDAVLPASVGIPQK